MTAAAPCSTALLAEVRAAGHPEAFAVLAARRRQIGDLIDAMPQRQTMGIPVHGDLHLGQVLRSDDRLFFIDFDGDPLTAGDHNPKPRPPAVDTASIIQSIDHAVRMAQHRRPQRDTMFDELAIQLATRHSTATAGGCPTSRSPACSTTHGCRPFGAAQELHELVHRSRLPRWIYVLTLALRGCSPMT